MAPAEIAARYERAFAARKRALRNQFPNFIGSEYLPADGEPRKEGQGAAGQAGGRGVYRITLISLFFFVILFS